MKAVLEQLLCGEHLSEDQAAGVMHALAEGAVDPVQAGSVLAALRAKGETPEEVRGFARVMRALAIRPELPGDGPLVDTCGTGGDGSGSLNISTGAALLAAACGLRIAKHGNRSISSQAGSADVLESLGLRVPLPAEAVGRCLTRTSFTFLFAPHHHPALRHVMPVRRALGVRTVFNLLGPLCNPATPAYQVAGAFSPGAARLMAAALAGLGVERAFVIHGCDGWDEATPIGAFVLFDVRAGEVTETVRDPADYGFDRCTAQDLRGGAPAENARRLAAVLRGEESGAHRDAVVLGAALALEVSGAAGDAREARAQAEAAIDDGRGAATLDALLAFGQEVGHA